jgi:L-malate glycosyltransferase
MLTVLLATRNGARTLAGLLGSLERLHAPPGGWKLVVADNGSTDETPVILDRFRPRLPLTVIREPRRGKNVALNAALAHLDGALAVFTDDDVLVDPGWLEALHRAADSRPDYSIFGGAIRPIWSRPPDPWILEWVDLAVTYTVTDPALPAGPIAPNLVWGPNMAIRASIFSAGFRFDEGVGPSGRDYAMGSETDLTLRLAAAGHRSWFCPEAVVGHLIRAEQMSRRWVLSRAERFGRGMYRRELIRMTSPPPLVFGVPRYLWRMLTARLGTYVLALPASARARFEAGWELRYLLGCIREGRRHFGGA